MSSATHHTERHRRTLLLVFVVLVTVLPSGEAVGKPPAVSPTPVDSTPMAPAIGSLAGLADIQAVAGAATLAVQRPGYTISAGPLIGTRGLWAQTHSGDGSTDWTAMAVPIETDDGSVHWTVLAVPTEDDGKGSAIVAVSEPDNGQWAWDFSSHDDDGFFPIPDSPGQFAFAAFSPLVYMVYHQYWKLTAEEREIVLTGWQLAMDVCGLIPGVGWAFDLGSAAISLVRGHEVEAALSLAAAIPVVGTFNPLIGARLMKLIKEVPAAVKARKALNAARKTLKLANPARSLKFGRHIAELDDSLNYVRVANCLFTRRQITYQCDRFGRVIRIYGWIERGAGKKANDAFRKFVSIAGKQGDESGHGLAASFGGLDDPANMFLQNELVNRSAQKGFENAMRAALPKPGANNPFGNRVWFDMRIAYEPNTIRPERFEYAYEIVNDFGRGPREVLTVLNNATADVIEATPRITAFLGLAGHTLQPSQLDRPGAQPDAPNSSGQDDQPEPSPVTPKVTVSKGDQDDDPSKGHWFHIDIEGLDGPPYHVQCATVNYHPDEIWRTVPNAYNLDRQCRLNAKNNNHVYVIVNGIRSPNAFWPSDRQ